MSEQPLVSIIIPAYNCAPVLAETINSALSQTWKNIEVIIVDDGSTDNTLSVAKEFEKGNKIIVFHQQNKGGSAARNKGFELSKGQYIQYVDGDDLMDNDKIEKQVRILANNPGCIVGGKWVRFRENMSETFGAVGPEEAIRKDMLPVDWLVMKKMMAVHAWLTPRELIQQAGQWNEELSCNQDGEFFYRVISRCKKILYEDDTTVYYRTVQGHGSVSKLNRRDKFDSYYMAALTYKHEVNRLEDSIRVKVAIGNNFKDLEYIFYPLHPDLVDKCRTQEEYRYATVKYNPGGKTQLLTSLIGWKATLRLKSWLAKS